MNKDLKEQIILSSIIDDLRKFEHKDLHQCPYCDEVFEWMWTIIQKNKHILARFVKKLLMKMNYKV